MKCFELLLTHYSGVAVGLVSTFRLVGGAVASAIYSSIQSNELARVLPERVIEAASTSGYKGSVSSLLKAAGTNTLVAYQNAGVSSDTIVAVQNAVKHANVQSFSLVFQVAIAFGGLGILGALCTRSVDVGKKNNDRAAVVENEKIAVYSKEIV